MTYSDVILTMILFVLIVDFMRDSNTLKNIGFSIKMWYKNIKQKVNDERKTE